MITMGWRKKALNRVGCNGMIDGFKHRPHNPMDSQVVFVFAHNALGLTSKKQSLTRMEMCPIGRIVLGMWYCLGDISSSHLDERSGNPSAWST